MANMASDLDTYTQIPLQIQPNDNVTVDPTTAAQAKGLAKELEQLNVLIAAIGQGIPPPPVPVNPQRTAAMTKLREQANTTYRTSNPQDALKLYSLALQMALGRPLWEPSGLMRDEVAGLYANRAQCYMAMRQWVEGWKDAECSVECKKGGNAKAWWRGGRCLVEMGRLEEAREWVKRGLEVGGTERDLEELLSEVEEVIARKAAY